MLVLQSVSMLAWLLQVITQEKSRRTVEYAFGFAFLNNRRKVTAIHKANIMKLSDGLFLKALPSFGTVLSAQTPELRVAQSLQML